MPLENQPQTPAQTTPAQPNVPADGVVDNGLVQGSPHPGDINAPAIADPASSAASAANAAATTQLPPGSVTPESAALATSARAMAAEMGLTQANQFQDDQTFLRAVIEQAQQASAAQAQLQQVQQYQAALAQAQALAAQQRQTVQTPAAKAPNAIWNPPEFDPSWNSLIRTDEKGVPSVIPGAPQEILPKYLAYQQYRQQFAERFLSNPEQTLLPLINQTAEERAREMVSREINRRQEEHYIQSFVSENSGWLHQRNPSNGQVVTNPSTGQPILSPAGQRFQQYVVQAHQSGITNVRQQEEYARTFLQRDIYMAQQATAQQQQQSQQAVIEANRRPNQAGMMPQYGQTPPPSVGMSLQDQMSLAMRTAGITDGGIDL